MSDFSFNIIEYLEDRDISYKTEGKNVSNNWIEITCPFCGDVSEHLGISLNGYGFNCWSCGMKGFITTLIKELEHTWDIATILDEYKLEDNDSIKKKSTKRNNKTFNLPREACEKPSPNHKRYIEEVRNFNLNSIIKNFNIHFCDFLSKKWMNRVIIPVYQDKQLVSFTSRDVTGKAVSKYKHCPNESSFTNIKHTLYNVDNCLKYCAIIVEGAIDVWRMGDDTLSTFGTQVTLQQIHLLRNFRRLFILFDDTAQENAEKLSHQLMGITQEIKIIQLEKGDPAELSRKEAQYIKKQIL